MIFTTTTEYAIRGLSEMASRAPDRVIMLDELVAGTDLPRDFLAKVFQKLVKARILTSSKGRGGGFGLARPPHEVTLSDIVDAIEGPQAMSQCVVGLSACSDAMPCAQHDLYKPIRQRLKDYLAATTLADMAESLKAKEAWQQRQRPQDPGRPLGTKRRS